MWVRNTLLDTDQYVSAVAPLASNPEVQQALAGRITAAVMTRVDVEQKITDALPDRGLPGGADYAGAVRNRTDQAALRLVESDRFQALWENANRRAHPLVVKVLTGGGSRVSTENGTVAINTEQIFENVKAKLDAKGITIFDDVTLPAKSQQFVLFQSKTLAQVQGLVDLLQTLAWGVAGPRPGVLRRQAIGLSKRRRRTMEHHAAIGVAIAVGVQLALLKAGRSLYLDAVTTKKSTPGAAAAVWDQVTSFLRTSGITVIVLALLIAFAAWVVGPSFPRLPASAAGGTERLGERADRPTRTPDTSKSSSPAPSPHSRRRHRVHVHRADRLEEPDRPHRARHRHRPGRLPRHHSSSSAATPRPSTPTRTP